MVEGVRHHILTRDQQCDPRRNSGVAHSGTLSVVASLPHPLIGPDSSLLKKYRSYVVHKICDLPCEPKYRPGSVKQVEQ